jgi:ubiquinone biosynthesis protein
MDFVRGKKITSLSPLGWIDIDGLMLAEQLFHAYLKQILVDGFFHADPHPGNVFLTEDKRIALIDLGMVGRIAPRAQENILQQLLAISEGRGDDVAEMTIKMGEPKADFDEQRFTRQVADLVTQHRDAELQNLDSGRIVLEIQRIAGETGFRLPPEFTLIAKALLNLDQVVHTLDPSFDPNASIRQHASEIMQQRLLQSLSPGNLFNALLETKGLFEKLPNRVSKLLETVANNSLSIKVDAIDEVKLMEGLQKVANRITLGLVLASLIIGAALLMRVETSFKIFGYPGLAIICFLAAAAGGVMLVVNIIFYDEAQGDK